MSLSWARKINSVGPVDARRLSCNRYRVIYKPRRRVAPTALQVCISSSQCCATPNIERETETFLFTWLLHALPCMNSFSKEDILLLSLFEWTKFPRLWCGCFCEKWAFKGTYTLLFDYWKLLLIACEVQRSRRKRTYREEELVKQVGK